MLVGTHDGGIDHGVFVICILRQGLEDLLPRAALAPARVAGVHHAEITKTRRQIAPGDAGALTVEHCIDEQPVVSRSRSRLSSLAGQQVLDALPVLISQGISSGHALSE